MHMHAAKATMYA